MRKLNKSTTLLIILSLVFLCANQSSNAQRRGPGGKSDTKPAEQTEMDKIVMAIQAGDIAKVQNAITASPNLVKKKDRNGYSLLYYAITGNQKDIAELLLHKGSNIKDTDGYGVPVLFIPIVNPSFHQSSSGKWAPTNMNDMIKFLIANGADIKQTDRNKRSILYYISQMNTNTNALNNLT